MTPHEAHIYNSAIEAAIKAYPKGIGAIMQLKVKYAVTVEHIGTTTKQDVQHVEKDG